jgi:hypothetical protein
MGVGQRGRTYNLLIAHQPLKTRGFDDFPVGTVGRITQSGSQLLPSCYQNL